MRFPYRTVVFALVCLAASSALHAQDARDLYQRGLDRLGKGDQDTAITDFDHALQLDPDMAAAYCSRGLAWITKGEYDMAIADFNEVIRLAPKSAEARYNRGKAWEIKRDYEKAFADYSEALRLNPNAFPVRNNLAWLQATCPIAKYRDGTKALENANHARQLFGADHWKIVATLAAAYAEHGDFVNAREWQEKAIQLASKDNSATDANNKELKSRLELYKAEQPYREPAKTQ